MYANTDAWDIRNYVYDYVRVCVYDYGNFKPKNWPKDCMFLNCAYI